MLPLDLSFAVLRVTLRALEPVHLPPFPGSKLEGAFGRALYRLACTQPQRETCQGCPLQTICPYGLSYAPRLPEGMQVSSLGTPPRPIIFRVAYGEEQWLDAGETLTFGLVVVGHAVTQLPYLLAALREVGREGLGRTRGRLELEEVRSVQPYTGEEVTLLRGADVGVNLSPLLLRAGELPPVLGERLRLHLRSPLHIKAGGQMAGHLHFPVLLRALQRRMGNLEQIHGGATSRGADFTRLPLLARDVETVRQDLRLVSQLRKGSRPQQKTNMEGLVGTVEYRGDFTPFASLLRSGEQLGVGKWAHFGAGLYDLEAAG
ncbi:CRISPR system precrRNA processing endoribonuclease RAMP protein Cas6 [Deinococcus sp. YIM 77859]|uniref:CRISPR system precrRNA processing endoribonuclease RAMP protein Cas6 n=1 Tax=Deinococcus sp. YIM 77859 TaxID=1540221 RepID=UPI0005586641|nr:CRISPR system precrRNA processing endoribonuclease RAMP protein Cas6 [Deinococcus sp. YIM 77859]